MSNPLALNLAFPVGSLDAYVQAVNRVPMLSAEEERDLARRFRDQQDIEAARQLVLSHLRFVVRVARGYNGYGLGQADLIQEGNIGLMKAVKRFDPNLGVRLVSFAVHWVRAEIHEFILRNWRIVKVATTKAQRKLFFNLRSAKKRLGWMNSAEVADVARELGVSTRDVMEMERRLSGHDTSFDPAPEQEGEGQALVPAAYLEDDSPGPEEALASTQDEEQQAQHLRLALENLDARSRAIVEARWLAEDKATLQDLADRFGISAERVRQLEGIALKRMRSAFAA